MNIYIVVKTEAYERDEILQVYCDRAEAYNRCVALAKSEVAESEKKYISEDENIGIVDVLFDQGINGTEDLCCSFQVVGRITN